MKPEPRPEDSSRAGPRTVRIGITGPIGCGKSTVAGWLGELGAVVIDADRVARQVTAPGTPALRAIISTFGGDLVRDGGELDRAALGRIVFSNAEALRALEAIVHPAVRSVILEEMEAAARAGAPAVVVEAIKLVEGGLAELCDAVWLIVCDPSVQRSRLLGRGDPPADAIQRIATQGDLRTRLTPFATTVIDTSDGPSVTRAAVRSAWDGLTRRLAE